MEILSKEEFIELANFQKENGISIYIPTHSSGIEVNERYDVIVFKNNLQKAKSQLAEKGLQIREVESILAPAFNLISDEEIDFWNKQSEGLAVFIAKDFFKIVQIPFTVKEEIMLNSSFMVAPLLPLIEKRHQFYLLVFSKHDCKFYEGNQFEMKKLEVEGLPTGMDDVVPFELKEERQTHRRAGAGAGRAAISGANYHGHGSGLSDEEEYLTQYLREVDQTLWKEVLHNQHVPLVLAAVDYEIALFKQISSYKYITEEGITGNFEHEDRQNLYLRSKEKITPYFKEYVNAALKNFYDNSTTGLSSSTVPEVISAAYYAQISDLFVEKNQHIWGTFNETDNEVTIHNEKQEGDNCLINCAIIKTLMNGGEVHMLDSEKMPVESKLAAFLRFTV